MKRIGIQLLQMMRKNGWAGMLSVFFFFAAQTSFAQSVRVGPDGQFSEQTLKLPYAFYNENFGFAGGFVYGKVGKPQKQALLLPIGNGRDEIISTVKIKDGLPLSEPKGGTSLNPFKSGRSYLEMRPFYRSQEIDGDDVDETVKTNGIDFSLFWDNRSGIPLTTGRAFKNIWESNGCSLCPSGNSVAWPKIGIFQICTRT